MSAGRLENNCSSVILHSLCQAVLTGIIIKILKQALKIYTVRETVLHTSNKAEIDADR